LLEIGVGHARAGRNVLLACYNMVLAAELRRMLLLDSHARGAVGAIDVVDVFQLLSRYSWDESDFEPGSYNASATNMVNRLISSEAPVDTYGTVLVDEAQDLEPWMYDLLHWHAEPQAEWFVAEGAGQALYRDMPAPWLREYAERTKQAKTIENLRRVFRTPKADFYVAQCTYEQSPEIASIGDWLERHPFHVVDSVPEPVDDPQFALDLGDLDFVDDDFDRLGTAPTLSNMPVLAETLSAAAYRDEVVKTYAALIAEELDLLQRIDAPGDLAILVPRTNKWSAMGERVCDALRLIGADYLDQVDDSHAKRRPLPANTVRVVTYHSARGLEASRVMLLGLEELGRKVGGTEQRIQNLAYVALSRAKHGTRIVVAAERTGPHLDFVKALVGRLSNEMEAAPPSAPATATAALATHWRDPLHWIEGEIARLVSERGFGFLAGPEGEHFFHINSLFDLDKSELEVGQRVRYTIEPADESPRATFVCRDVPPGLTDPPKDSRVAALVIEPVGDRGFGFLLSPSVSGRIFFHHSSLDGDKAAERPARGDRVDAAISSDTDGRPRAINVRLR
jgi:cold shock CspA family protein